MENQKKSQHSAGDELFKNAPEHAKKLHREYKKTKRKQDRESFMQRQAESADFR